MTKQALLEEALKLPSDELEDFLETLATKFVEANGRDDEEYSPEFIAELDQIDREIREHPERLVSLEEVQRRARLECKK